MAGAWAQDNGTWRLLTALWAQDNGNWRLLTAAWVQEAGTWRQFWPALSATVDCVQLRVCTVPLDGALCDSDRQCATRGEAHRVMWTHTGCDDLTMHVEIWRSKNGGTYFMLEDNVSCDAPDPDNGCCEGSDCGTEDGEWIEFEAYAEGTGQTTDFDFEVRIKTDIGDTLLDSGTDGCTDCGSDGACVE